MTFKLSDEELKSIYNSLDDTGGHLIKESELKFWIEFFVNREMKKPKRPKDQSKWIKKLCFWRSKN